MRDLPDELADEDLRQAITAGWDVDVDELVHVPAGAGAHHWAAGDGRRRWFVTVDDLTTKPWLGNDVDQVESALADAYRVAIRLAAGGSAFVVAPLPTRAGRPLTRLDRRHTLALFPFVEGAPGAWGADVDRSGRDELVDLLASLHETATSTRGLRSCGPEVADHAGLEAVLAATDRPWETGPFAEAARSIVGRHRAEIRARLAAVDGVARRIDDGDAPDVLTHGEPHPGNVLHAPEGLRLIDWDTVARSHRERDLWMLADDPVALGRYCDRTGATLDPELLAAFRSVWALSDVAAYGAQLRRAHADTADARRALDALRTILEGDEPRPYGRITAPDANRPARTPHARP